MNLFTDVLAGGCFHGISNVIKLKSRWKKIQKKIAFYLRVQFLLYGLLVLETLKE